MSLSQNLKIIESFFQKLKGVKTMEEKPQTVPVSGVTGTDDQGKKHFSKKQIRQMLDDGLSVEQIKAIIEKADAESQKTLRHIFYLQFGAKIVESIVSKVASTWKISIIFTFLTVAVNRLTDNNIVTVLLAILGISDLFV